jgi:hypothetical protein
MRPKVTEEEICLSTSIYLRGLNFVECYLHILYTSQKNSYEYTDKFCLSFSSFLPDTASGYICLSVPWINHKRRNYNCHLRDGAMHCVYLPMPQGVLFPLSSTEKTTRGSGELHIEGVHNSYSPVVMRTTINPLKTKRICFIYGLSAYRAVNTLHFGYKNQSLNVL